jgi:poly(hydroxyalkanoate) depolymerase family esterase
MINITHPDLLKATALTREGRLAEATALLQRILGAPASARGDSGDAGGRTEPVAAPGTTVIDGVFERVAEADVAASSLTQTDRASGGRHAKAPLPSQSPAMLRDLLGSLGRSLPGLGAHGLAKPPVPTADLVPAGGRFIQGSYSNGSGSRVFKLYLPSSYAGQALPLIVMLHGCTQSPDDFAAGTRMNLLAEQQSCLVVYPEQSSTANASKCWNWFNTDDQQRDRGEPALIAGITRQIMRDYAVDPRQVYVAGLSAGAAAAAVMGATYPDLYAAVGVHSGLACGAAKDLPSAFSAMRLADASSGHLAGRRAGSDGAKTVPTIVFHGDEDHTVHPGNGDRVIAQSMIVAGTLTEREERGQVPGGLAYTRKTHVDATGRTVLEQWVVHGLGHAWSGGSPAGSYTDPRGPDAAGEMIRFFLEQARPGR